MNRSGSILVIDDEEIMREILDALLTRQGYSAAQAGIIHRPKNNGDSVEANVGPS